MDLSKIISDYKIIRVRVSSVIHNLRDRFRANEQRQRESSTIACGMSPNDAEHASRFSVFYEVDDTTNVIGILQSSTPLTYEYIVCLNNAR